MDSIWRFDAAACLTFSWRFISAAAPWAHFFSQYSGKSPAITSPKA
jgi:hypothetical protein